LHQAHGIVGVRDADDVPADHALRELLALVEVVPAEPELRGVVLRPPAPIDAADVELPAAREDRALDRDAIAELPLEALDERLAPAGAALAGEEALPLVLGHHELRIHPAILLALDGELREEVALALVHPAEPVREGHRGHAGDARDPVAIGERQRLDD